MFFYEVTSHSINHCSSVPSDFRGVSVQARLEWVGVCGNGVGLGQPGGAGGVGYLPPAVVPENLCLLLR